MATMVHFNISASDSGRAKEFYEELFDWKFRQLSAPMNYYLIETRDLDGNPGVGGGLAKREDPEQTGITSFIGVASLDDSLKKVEELGGRVVQPKQALPGWGYMAMCTDTENNLFGLFQEESTAR